MKRLSKGVIAYVIIIVMYFILGVADSFVDRYVEQNALYMTVRMMHWMLGPVLSLLFFVFPVVYGVLTTQKLKWKALYPLLIMVIVLAIIALSELIIRFYR